MLVKKKTPSLTNAGRGFLYQGGFYFAVSLLFVLAITMGMHWV